MGLITFAAFTLLVAVISYFASRKTDETTSDGYFLGGRSLTGPVIAGSLLLTNLSTEQIIGTNGVGFSAFTKIPQRWNIYDSSIFGKTLRKTYENDCVNPILNGLRDFDAANGIVFWSFGDQYDV